MIGLHHPDLFQGGWKAMNQTTDGTVQGHLLVSMVTKSSLATENLECKQQEPVCGCHVWKEASHKGKGGKGGAPAGSPGQKEELLYLKTNFPEKESTRCECAFHMCSFPI